MPTIINPFTGPDPTAQAFESIGKQFFSGPDPAALLRNEQIRALQRKNVETELLAKDYMNFGQPNFDPRRIAARSVLAGNTDYGNMGRYLAASVFGAQDPRTTDAMIGAGDAYSSTPAGFNATLAENRRQFDQKPMPALVDNQPRFVPYQGAFGVDVQPILSDAERKGTAAAQNWGNMGALPEAEQNYLGAAPGEGRAPFNYIVRGANGQTQTFLTRDGVSDLYGNPLPPGGYRGNVQGGAGEVGLTNAVQTDEQSKNLAYQRMNTLLNMAESLTSDPTRFGIVGKARSYGQEAVQILNNIGALTGGNAASVLDAARQDMARNRISPTLLPELYDPSLDEVNTVWGLMVYQGASALAGQENRSVSDKDVQFFRQILGDPQSFFSSAEAMKARIAAARNVMRQFSGITDKALGIQTDLPGAAPSPPPQGAPPPAAETPVEQPPVPGARKAPDGNWYVEKDGKYYRVEP